MDVRLGVSVSAPFVWRCLSSRTVVPVSTPPSSNRTGAFGASGLYGAFFVKGASRHFWRPLSFHSFVRPAPRAFFRPDRIFPSPSRAATVKDGREHGGRLPAIGWLAAR